MTRVLPLLIVVPVLAAACIIPPSDAAQIRQLEKDRASAIARGDTKALYRLHDLDFRAVCPLDRFPLPAYTASAGSTLRDIEIRGVRAWATVDDAGTVERRSFVKDGGRWYLYASAEVCSVDSELRTAYSWSQTSGRTDT